MITQEFDLNLIPDQEPVIVHVSQYDIGEGRLIAHLYNGDLAYTPTSGATVTIQGTKPDRFGFMYDAALSGNTVTADLTEQMCAVAGRVVVNIIVHESDNRTGTFNFFLDVQKAALGDDTVISDSDGNIYNIPELVESAEEYAERAETAAENSQSSSYDSEAWAKGTRNGTAVLPTDETYHNNSKYFSEVSGDYVEDSEAWAVGKRGGTAVPSTDSAYHNNSKYYAEQAEDSADHAADIVNNANYLIGVDPVAIGNPRSPYGVKSYERQISISPTAIGSSSNYISNVYLCSAVFAGAHAQNYIAILFKSVSRNGNDRIGGAYLGHVLLYSDEGFTIIIRNIGSSALTIDAINVVLLYD